MAESNNDYKTVRLRVGDVELLKQYAGRKHNGVMTKALNQLLTQDAIDDYQRKKALASKRTKLLQVLVKLEGSIADARLVIEALKKEISSDNE